MFGVVSSAILLLTLTAPAVTTTETLVDCSSDGYTQLSTGYYKVHDIRKSWDDASSTCSSEGGYLAVLNNEEEARVVTDFAFNKTLSMYGWVGIRDRIQDGGWHSVRGEPLSQIYHKWADSRSAFYESCGALKFDGFLDDVVCSGGLKFICEKSCHQITLLR